jgi:hypothetical protein
MAGFNPYPHAIRQINELEEPYTSYCERYCTGFDTWEPVRNNTRLPGVLAAFSANLPPPSASSGNPDTQIWTLDELFLLPTGRLKYFKKLYGRLLKGTQPGRSDYKLLAGAAEKLDKLLAIQDARAMIKAGSPPAVSEAEDEVVVDLRSPTEVSKLQELPPIETITGSETSSARGSSLSSACVSVHVLMGSRRLHSSQCKILQRHKLFFRGTRANRRFVDSFT